MVNKKILATDLEDDEIMDDEHIEKHIVFEGYVDKGQEPIRIDKFIMTKIAGSTRNKVQSAIDDELVLINGKPIKSNYKVRPNDHLIIYTFNEPISTEILPEDITLNIVYEDNDVLVINKPPNFVVHPGHGNWSGTVVNAVLFHFQKNNIETETLSRIGLVHRIDKDTSGLLVLGKTEKAIQHLMKQFKDHTVDRKYVALVWGNVEEETGTIETYIGRNERNRKIFTTYHEEHEGKHAITHYRVLERLNYVTLVECKLETGRTHQIRVHMKHIGHTLFNDATYGGEKILKGTIFSKYKSFVENCFTLLPRQALHAKTLGFIHPTTGKHLLFESELPENFEALLTKWRTYVKAKKLDE